MKLHGEWSIWEWFCVRAPGFAADLVSGLNAPGAAAAADRLDEARRSAAVARDGAIAVLERIIPPTKALNKAVRALRRGEPPAGELLPELEVTLGDVRATHAAVVDAKRTADEAALGDNRRVATFLLGRAGDPQLREALLWQNRDAVHNSVASLLRRPVEAEDSKTREQRRLVASAVQRYSVKNDTIGFFGPAAWGKLVDAVAPITVTPGPALLRHRHVYFEYWCIDTLAQKLAQEPALRPYLRPRRSPSIGLEGVRLHHPNGQKRELPAPVARLLALADGQLTAREIASRLAAEHHDGFETEQDVFELLAECDERKLCAWTIELPTATFHPELHLREALAAAPDDVRAPALAQLAALEARRDDIAAAAGDSERLDAALGALEATFVELTATSATRKGGETYAGRTLVFEDCLRDVAIEIGTPVVARMAPALALVMQSARWFTHTIARRYQTAFRALYRELRVEASDQPVDYIKFRDRMKPLFPGTQHSHGIAHDVGEELRTGWEAALGIEDGSRVITRASSDLAAAIATRFAAPGPGWPSARHHSPDLMIAAESLDAIARGELRFVLGELHVGFNTVTLPCLLKEHPDPEVLVRLRERDLPRPGVAPVWSKARNRADFFSTSRHDFDLETATRSTRPPAQVLASGELVVDEQAGRLVVRTRDGATTFPLIAFVEQHLIAESFARFRLLERRAHSPRVMIDDVVIQRESWRFDCEQLTFAGETDELDRFVAARRFARDHGIGQRVFVKADGEPKPFYVDFTSSILLDVFARQLRRSRTVVISEMLPDLGACWLTDAAGQHYTSELRIAVCDPVEWSPELLD